MKAGTRGLKLQSSAVVALVAFFACAGPARPQSSAAGTGNAAASTSGSADPASLTRATEALLHARARIDKFFEQTANVVCNEDVAQTVVGKNGKPLYREESEFEYQLETSSRGGALKMVESRDPHKEAFRDPSKTLLITNGFASMLLVLHPQYEQSYVFDPVAEEWIDERMVEKIHFRQIPGSASPAAMQLRGRNYPLPLAGDVWIEEQSGSVVKLVAALGSSMDDMGLHDLRSEIHYAVVQFHDPEEAYWMPSSAVIDVETPKQHWRNIHRFTSYKRFRTSIQVNFGEPKP